MCYKPAFSCNPWELGKPSLWQQLCPVHPSLTAIVWVFILMQQQIPTHCSMGNEGMNSFYRARVYGAKWTKWSYSASCFTIKQEEVSAQPPWSRDLPSRPTPEPSRRAVPCPAVTTAGAPAGRGAGARSPGRTGRRGGAPLGGSAVEASASRPGSPAPMSICFLLQGGQGESTLLHQSLSFLLLPSK